MNEWLDVTDWNGVRWRLNLAHVAAVRVRRNWVFVFTDCGVALQVPAEAAATLLERIGWGRREEDADSNGG